MDGQLSIFSTELQVGCKKPDCSSCACGRPGSPFYRDYKECLWASLPDSYPVHCPEALKRSQDDIPDKNPSEFDRYMWNRSWCHGCYGCTEDWREHTFHRYNCQSYLPTTRRTEECLLYSIQAWDLPDGTTIKWCAVCEANGCEGCYKQWSEAQDFIDNYEE